MITVYVLRSLANGKRYVGVTDEFRARMIEHHRPGSPLVKILGSFEVMLSEDFGDYDAAHAREAFLKSAQGTAWLNSLPVDPDR